MILKKNELHFSFLLLNSASKSGLRCNFYQKLTSNELNVTNKGHFDHRAHLSLNAQQNFYLANVGSKININWVTGYQLHWACHCAIYDASLAKQTHMRINIAKRVKVHMVTFNVGLPACFSIKYIEMIIKYIEIIIVS